MGLPVSYKPQWHNSSKYSFSLTFPSLPLVPYTLPQARGLVHGWFISARWTAVTIIPLQDWLRAHSNTKRLQKWMRSSLDVQNIIFEENCNQGYLKASSMFVLQL